jgi:superfamily II DNA or RNA helicase
MIAASEEGKVVWQRTLREAKQRLAVAPTTDSESSVAASSTTKAEPRALVLVPTRELCQQISDAANEIVKFIAESSVCGQIFLIEKFVMISLHFHSV